MKIVWLDQLQYPKINLVGGKAAHLGKLAAHYPVPPGFCVTTDALDLWINNSDDARSEDCPDVMTISLRQAYHMLEERCNISNVPVAVRSSAVGEDSATASFAGQYETYLNVVGAEAVISAVKRCWQSAQSDRVQAYQQQRDTDGTSTRIAVLVQHLVEADTSAVVFSLDPVTNQQDVVTINATWGLGESLVSGEVTPDSYTVSKSDLQILERNISQKQTMTVRLPTGTREVAVPRMMQHQPAITNIQVQEIARLAIDLEKEVDWPVDVECAYQGDKLFLLQCRSVTTLSTNQ